MCEKKKTEKIPDNLWGCYEAIKAVMKEKTI